MRRVLTTCSGTALNVVVMTSMRRECPWCWRNHSSAIGVRPRLN